MSTRSFLIGCAVATSAIAFWVNVDRLLSPRQAAAPPAIEQHFAPAENLERIDVDLIGEAGETLDVAAYVLTDYAVISALTYAAARGVRVRLYRQPDEHEPSSDLAAALARLAAAGAATRTRAQGQPLMHLKAYCVDGHALRVGAANFSRSGLTAQENDLEVLRGPGVCAGFEARFEQLWGTR